MLGYFGVLFSFSAIFLYHDWIWKAFSSSGGGVKSTMQVSLLIPYKWRQKSGLMQALWSNTDEDQSVNIESHIQRCICVNRELSITSESKLLWQSFDALTPQSLQRCICVNTKLSITYESRLLCQSFDALTPQSFQRCMCQYKIFNYIREQITMVVL